jgi:hypothetical protein
VGADGVVLAICCAEFACSVFCSWFREVNALVNSLWLEFNAEKNLTHFHWNVIWRNVFYCNLACHVIVLVQ